MKSEETRLGPAVPGSEIRLQVSIARISLGRRCLAKPY